MTRFRKTLLAGSIAFCALCLHAGAQTNPSVSVAPEIQGKEEPPNLKWEYTLTFNGIIGTGPLRVTVPITKNVFWAIRESDRNKVQDHNWQEDEWHITPKAASISKGTFELKIVAKGPQSELQNKTSGLKWKFAVSGKKAGTADTSGPEALPSNVKLLFGVGADIGLDDYIDFKEETVDDKPFLLTVNDSQFRASGQVGLAFKVADWKKKPVDIFASLNFVDNTAKTIDGFVFGTSIGIAKNLGIALGYSLRKKSELSFGFRRAAAQFLTDTTDENLKARFPLSGGVLDNDKLFDGLPLVDGNAMRYFPGSPIVDSFNHAFFIGLTFPIGFKTLFAGANE